MPRAGPAVIDTILFYYGISALAVFLYMSMWAVMAWWLKRNDVADVAWGLGFVCVALTLYLANDVHTVRQTIATILVGIWGLRLSLHIFQRLTKKPEDYRYQAMRAKWKNNPFWHAYFQVFMLQGFLMLLVSSSLVVIAHSGALMRPLDYVGVVIWIIGFVIESVSDSQLKKFVLNRKDKNAVMSTGLWQYSRHPNYFGEITQWWGIGVLGAGLGFTWLSLLGPLVITVLIVKVSGIPLLEKKYLHNKAYQAYAAKTSTLIPWPPKK